MTQKQNYLVILLIIMLLITELLNGCQLHESRRTAIEKEGKLYGITKGAFRHRWWNYYERGCSFLDGGFWQEAEADLREALSMSDTDQRRERTYGMHFIDYFPHRELGISLFYQNQYKEAIQELKASLSSEVSARAEFYLNKARESQIEQENSDTDSPQIFIESPREKATSNMFAITVRGVATDDTFVKAIQINGKPIRIDLSAPEISFQSSVPISIGENIIHIIARDLTGKTTRIERKILCDRAGPILNIDELISDVSGNYILKGYAYDESGIKMIQVNEQKIVQKNIPEIVLNHSVLLSSYPKKAIVIAEDQLGNQTRAEVFPSQISQVHKTPQALFASIDMLPFLLHDSKTHEVLIKNRQQIPKKHYAFNRPAISSKRLKGMLKHYRESGTYYAMIIGINDYDEWTPLQTAVNDAVTLKEILVRRYHFSKENIILRTNKDATRVNLIQDLRQLAAGLTENDNLLIYYAGHGQLDELTSDGYWVPVEGKLKNPTTWITHSFIKSILSSEKVRGKNIMVIADSCYSGTLLRSGPALLSASERNYQVKILELAYKKSRQIITSGGTEPVADIGRDNHSLFAYYLLKALEENPYAVIDMESLVIDQVWKSVSEKGGQRPTIGRLNTLMDEEGQFVLVFKSDSAQGDLVLQKRTAQGDLVLQKRATERLVDTSPPYVDIRDWTEDHNTVYLDRAYLEGNARDDYGVQNLAVNDEKILKRPGRNIYFNHLAELKEGENNFRIRCADPVGNLTEKEVRILRKLQKVREVGSRISLVIFPFEQKGSHQAQPVEVEDILQGRLIDSKRFKVKMCSHTERGNESVLPDVNEAKRLAQESEADLMLMGKVIAKEKSLEISARMVDVDTLEILSQKDVYDEEIDKETIKTLCHGLTLKIQDEFPMAEGLVIQIQDKQIVVDMGKSSGVKSGMKLIIYQAGAPIRHPISGKVLGPGLVKELGEATICSVMDEMSFAVLNKRVDDAVIQPLHQVITR